MFSEPEKQRGITILFTEEILEIIRETYKLNQVAVTSRNVCTFLKISK